MKPHICFVALNCYNLLSGRKDIGHIGGAEVQQVLIARWLVRNGYKVSFVTHDYGQPDAEVRDGITIFKASRLDDGIPIVRFIHPRMTLMWSAMSRADADIYYQRGAGAETGKAALWCTLNKRRFIFASANDEDCRRGFSLLRVRREKIMYWLGLKLVDRIIAQTTTQQQLLREELGLESTIVRNCGSEPGDYLPVPREKKSVLWIGRISPEKRFEWLLDLAARCPALSFHVVGVQNVTSEYAEHWLGVASEAPNVHLHGRIPHDEMDEYYRHKAVLCSTSVSEGFPNVFLEAWRLGMPVLSTIDPDGIIERYGIGWVCASAIALADRLESLGTEELEAASRRARQYYVEHHTPEITLASFERVLTSLLD